MTTEAPLPAPTARTTFHRRPQRGAHDRASVDAVLDAGVVGQIGYLMEGEPRVLPTLYWRTGDHLYWHGSRESRALLAMAGREVCFSVTLLDGLVMARSAFHHSANYRSVIAFGPAETVTGEAAKLAASRALLDRLYPGRWDQVRAPSRAELAATLFLRLPLTEASAKARTGPPIDAPRDLSQPGWAGVIPVSLGTGTPEPAADLRPGGAPLAVPQWLGG